MEITHRPTEDIGTNLWCPADDLWSHRLILEVRPGDRVLHWRAATPGVEAAIVAWSEVTGMPRKGRTHYYDDVSKFETWQVTLGGANWFRQPVTANSLLPLLGDLMNVRDEVEATHGKPIYFPFINYARRQLRARQAYLTKFPSELFGVIPRIQSARM